MKKSLLTIFLAVIFSFGGLSALAESKSDNKPTQQRKYNQQRKYKKSKWKKRRWRRDKPGKTIPIEGGIVFFLISAGTVGIYFLRKKEK